MAAYTLAHGARLVSPRDVCPDLDLVRLSYRQARALLDVHMPVGGTVAKAGLSGSPPRRFRRSASRHASGRRPPVNHVLCGLAANTALPPELVDRLIEVADADIVSELAGPADLIHTQAWSRCTHASRRAAYGSPARAG
ncbi:hypothetical protein [Streptomyces ureilyticus]|uniref:hypothetical protein n=1 Tax=Streptomyces ureilyticus TaxID=1775131 RepID=UPI0038B5D2CA